MNWLELGWKVTLNLVGAAVSNAGWLVPLAVPILPFCALDSLVDEVVQNIWIILAGFNAKAQRGEGAEEGRTQVRVERIQRYLAEAEYAAPYGA